MALYPPSDLDANQCIQGAYDDANSCLRVEGVLADGAIEVAINSATDSITIGNPNNGNTLLINADGSINVEGTIVATNPSVGPTGTTAPTSATEIGGVDTGGNLIPFSVSDTGVLNVNVVNPGSSGTTVSSYNEVTAVAMNASATVNTYTVPAGHTFSLTRVNCSGDSLSTWVLNFNGTPNAKERMYYTGYNLKFDYNNGQSGFSLAAGTVITIVATNNSLNGVASFNSTIQGILN